MSVSLLLVTHGLLGEDIRHTAVQMLGKLPLPTEAVTVHLNSDPEEVRTSIGQHLSRLDSGDGVLIFTDTFGSTPSNLAIQASRPRNCRIVAGLNVPMLIRVYNYPDATLAQLAEIAHEGGRRGVMICEQDD